jgi:hypothetical protein
MNNINGGGCEVEAENVGSEARQLMRDTPKTMK